MARRYWKRITVTVSFVVGLIAVANGHEELGLWICIVALLALLARLLRGSTVARTVNRNRPHRARWRGAVLSSVGDLAVAILIGWSLLAVVSLATDGPEGPQLVQGIAVWLRTVLEQPWYVQCGILVCLFVISVRTRKPLARSYTRIKRPLNWILSVATALLAFSMSVGPNPLTYKYVWPAASGSDPQPDSVGGALPEDKLENELSSIIDMKARLAGAKSARDQLRDKRFAEEVIREVQTHERSGWAVEALKRTARNGARGDFVDSGLQSRASAPRPSTVDEAGTAAPRSRREVQRAQSNLSKTRKLLNDEFNIVSGEMASILFGLPLEQEPLQHVDGVQRLVLEEILDHIAVAVKPLVVKTLSELRSHPLVVRIERAIAVREHVDVSMKSELRRPSFLGGRREKVLTMSWHGRERVRER
jgi:hypothetical protein